MPPNLKISITDSSSSRSTTSSTINKKKLPSTKISTTNTSHSYSSNNSKSTSRKTNEKTSITYTQNYSSSRKRRKPRTRKKDSMMRNKMMIHSKKANRMSGSSIKTTTRMKHLSTCTPRRTSSKRRISSFNLMLGSNNAKKISLTSLPDI